MRKAVLWTLSGLGVLFLLALGALGFAAAKLPKERTGAALAALKGEAPAPAVPLEAEPPADAGILLDARARLEEDRGTFQQETTLALAQIQAERSELEALQATLQAGLETLAREQAKQAQEGSPAGKAAGGTGSDKGMKAVAEMAARMTPKDAAQLLSGQGDAEAARILRRMDPKQAGKVMSAFVETDAGRAGRIVTLMREGTP